MASLKIWLKALRVPFFTATIIPVLLGSAVAWHDTGMFSWPLFFLILFGALFLHAGTNLSNDFFDHVSKNDVVNKTPTPFSGGSRVIQEKLIPAKSILIAAAMFFILGGVIGLYLNAILPNNIILWIGIIGLFFGFFYTAYPLRLGYNGLGEIAVGLGFGPIVVMAAYFVQTQTLSFNTFFISIPIGILIALVLFINEFPDYKADKKVRKNTLVVLLGKKNSVNLYVIFLLLAYLLVMFGAFYKIIPYFALISLFSFPLAFMAAKTLVKNYDKVNEILPANKATIGLHIIFGILLSIGYVLDKVFQAVIIFK